MQIWYGAVVRADKNKIKIGAISCVQDRAVINTVTSLESGYPADVNIGHYCTIGPGAGAYTSSRQKNRRLLRLRLLLFLLLSSHITYIHINPLTHSHARTTTTTITTTTTPYKQSTLQCSHLVTSSPTSSSAQAPLCKRAASSRGKASSQQVRSFRPAPSSPRDSFGPEILPSTLGLSMTMNKQHSKR
jgi:hypothetical protein